ncbi:Cyclin-dependent_kinases regulatory subunit [Hexamita inflata]|uniref:Cyclin-dependent kinases regulatory subunit n=1 Tax=Hexamita inflata TaxID=28002 RepID=A0AA86NJK9_9EUKA|nr:Cyclin-dependent kinases regulatory subunit [Hexamita inflata]CAI9926092.1 Cyclin-dependent kinases regulatory subunit [Hexamita inflata]CAI9976152.1 Cyclin-dependent kinases regulatory subunit [Hexamita inflata]
MTSANGFYYSRKYYDETFEYRHVILPEEVARKYNIQERLLAEQEWRSLGIQMSAGWVHYDFHRPEPHILLFRRPHNGQIPEEYKNQ